MPHAMIHLDNDIFLLAFSSRLNQHANIFLAHAEIKNEKINLISKPQVALKPSKPGYFDSEGLLNCCFVKHNKKFIYIIQGGKYSARFLALRYWKSNRRPSKLSAKENLMGQLWER